MKNKIIILFLTILIIVATKESFAQMVGPDAYIKGNNVEIGINGLGGFEGINTTISAPPSGMHPRSATLFFGFVANPQLNSWATFDGDFFTPGTPENGWGIEIGSSATNISNNCNYQNDISGSITNYTNTGTDISVDWEGNISNLHFLINYTLGINNLYYITTINVTNNGAATIPAVYYYRNVDPDNNEELSFDFTTYNTVISQSSVPLSLGANVKATQTNPWNSNFEFLSEVDTNWRAGFGGFSNRDASDMWTGTGFTQTVGAVNFADEAIFVAYRIQNLAPGATETFKFATIFDTVSYQCVYSQLAANFPPLPNVLTTTPAFSLNTATPSGGIYSGAGVISGNTFDPSIAGSGVHSIQYTYTDTNSCSVTVSSLIHVNTPTNISSNENNTQFNIFPNPITDNYNLVFESENYNSAQIVVYDITGKIVTQQVVKCQKGKNKIVIDSSDYSKGIYFIKITVNGNDYTKKLIK